MMHRYLPTILLLFAGAAAWAQESAPDEEPESQAAQETAEQAPADREDDSDLDDESYQDAEEEDFVPTEDIPADQAIPFPTDI